MADYGVQPGSRNGRPNNMNYPPPGGNYRGEAAYRDIFGGQRSQTMSSSSMAMGQERTATMGSQMSGGGPRPPPMRHQPEGYGQPMPNGHYQNQRQPNGLVQQQPQPQYLPQPLNPERRPYPGPQRVDPRYQSSQSFQGYNRQPPNRGHPPQGHPPQGPPPGPAMNSDPYRSRSMMTNTAYGQPQNSYNNAPANTFRQQQYHSVGSRTTAQGRAIPERQDDRSMSMTSWSGERDHNQTMSGRVIPNRRRESGPDGVNDGYNQNGTYAQPTRTETMTSTATTVATQASGAGAGAQNSSRTMSMASTITPDRADSLQHRPSMSNSLNASTPPPQTNARSPLVYPALLSRVAQAFLERIDAREREKHQLTYQLAFTGKDAVDLIAYIIKTNDRNLALLLGRALDAQKFFHDVTYEHRLRDSASELYQFREAVLEDPTTDVNGVYTLLTECYSPTCTRDRLCYSIACPRRLEQQSRLNLRPQPGLRRQASASSLHNDEPEEQKLWINTVSKEVAESIGDKEKKRQEVISELMYTERDFVKDLEYLRDFWIRPLRQQNQIPEQKREMFVRTVFSNAMDVHAVNSRFADALTRRQQENPVVKNIGDIFLQFVPRFGPFIEYGAHQLFGKYEFEREKGRNQNFSRFVDETERLKESRKLELNGYLTKPTTRLARYPLLLEAVLKATDEDNPDQKDIPAAVKGIKAILHQVNIESGKAENRFSLLQLHQNLRFPPEYNMDLKLTDEARKMVYKTQLKKGLTDNAEIVVFLFDHAVLMAKQKTGNKAKEELKVYRKPIPLELLVVAQMDEILPKPGIAKRPSSSLTLSSLGARAALNAPRPAAGAEKGFPITFKYLGKPPYEITLFAPNMVSRTKLMEHIESQQSLLRDRTNVYTKNILCDNFFTSQNKVNCLVPIDGGRKIVYGTENGIYLSDRRPRSTDMRPKRVLELNNVTQLDVLEEYQLLLILANKTLLSFPLDGLEPSQQATIGKRPKKIAGHANFFRAGVCVGKHLVCTAKSSGLSTTIKVFEPMDTITTRTKGPGIAGFFKGNQDTFRPFKEFYIPTESTSIHFLKTKLCVACAKGFEIVSLETLETQSLLDQADTSLDFVAREKETRPVHIERLNGEFLLNYSEFSFFVNRNGWRARPELMIQWEGQPTAFALSYPYILAFEPSFIEIRHVESGMCEHILTAKNIRMLHASTREILYAYEEETGEDVVASLDFWSNGRTQQHG